MNNSFRRCPSCGAIFPTGSLKPLPALHRGDGRGQSERSCPSCGHSGPLASFVRVPRRGPEREVAAFFTRS